MNYKETLFFVGKCLTISHEEHNKIIVEELIKNGAVDWDNVVKVSTNHYVFPALYCNLKRAGFLNYLPSDLVEYMKHITDLNRERNKQIIQQAKEINQVLLKNGITPIFLKGTGNLLEGLYHDIAERMVGDIDFLVSKKEYGDAIKIMLEDGYSYVSESKFFFPSDKHYPRLQKDSKIAAIEIHKDMTIGNYAKIFNFGTIKENTFNKDSITFLNFRDQLKLSIIAKQVNDDGQYHNDISLRNAYDTFLLAQKTETRETIQSTGQLLQKPLNNFLAITKEVLNSQTINHITKKEAEKYVRKFVFLMNNPKDYDKHKKYWTKRRYYIKLAKILLKSFTQKEYFFWLIKRVRYGRQK
jgi:hypothetical protein